MRSLNGTKWARKHCPFSYTQLRADVKGDVVTLKVENPNIVIVQDSEGNIHQLGRFEFWENFYLLSDDGSETPIEFDTSIGKMLLQPTAQKKDDEI